MQILWFRSVLLASLVWFGFLASLLGAADPEAIYKEATEKREAGDIAGAIEGYSRVLELDPQAVEVWFERGTARMIRCDWGAARADFSQIIHLNPEHVRAYRLRGAVLQEEKDYEGAMADLDRAVALDPYHAGTYSTRGEIRSAQERWEEALVEFNESIRLDDSMPGVFFQRAKVLSALGEARAAIEDYTRVLKQNPKFAEAWRARAWLRFQAYEWEEAIADARIVLELEPKSADAARAVGFAQFGARDYAASAVTLGKAADLAGDELGDRAFPIFMRHLALVRQGAPDDRLKKELASWDPESWATAIGRFLLGELSEDELDGLAEQGEHRDGRQCEVNFYIGVLRLHAGDKPTARLRFRASVAAKMTDYIEHTLAYNELFEVEPWKK